MGDLQAVVIQSANIQTSAVVFSVAPLGLSGDLDYFIEQIDDFCYIIDPYATFELQSGFSLTLNQKTNQPVVVFL